MGILRGAALGGMAALTVFFAWGLLGLLSGPDEPVAQALATAQEPEVRRVSFDAPPMTRFEEIAERPLLSPTRRPPAPEAAAEQTAPPFEASLTGLFKIGSSHGALFALRSGGARLAKVGDRVQGWRVAEIGEAGVVVRRDGRERRLALEPLAEARAGAGATGGASRPEPRADRPARAASALFGAGAIDEDDD